LIVVDTNVVASLYLASDRSDQAERVLARDPDWAVPLLWRSELRNVLVTYMRHRQLPLADALDIMETAEALLRGREYSVPSLAVLQLAGASRCSSYDCELVALARQLDVPLVTVDGKILAGFPETAIALQVFAGGE
jgi:predicted nucleic acid-binding protein